MEGINLIEGKELNRLKERLTNIEQSQLAIIKLIQQLVPQNPASHIPEFISLEDASEKYHVSVPTLYNKFKLFKAAKNREIDRLQSGSYYLINEFELQEAMRLKGEYVPFFKTNKPG